MPTGVLADSERSVSPVIAVVLTAALAIVLSVTIGAFVLSSGDDGTTQEPAPTISAEIERGPGDLSSLNEKITISHKGGDTVDVSELKIVTETVCFDSTTLALSETRSEIVDMPVDGSNGIEDTNVNGENIFQGSFGATDPPLREPTDGDWKAGTELTFEIDNGECDVRENAPVRVEVIHKPSNAVIQGEAFGSANFQTNSPADASYDYSFPNPRPGSAGFPDDKDVLTVGITDGGPFPPDSVYLDVTVEDNEGDTASANGTLVEWDGRGGSSGATYDEIDAAGVSLVGGGDRLGVDLTSAASGSGPGGFGPLDEDGSSTTDIDIKVKFLGDVVDQKTLTATDFEVEP